MRERITSAHILALIAIILAVGGNAFAFTLGKNSVGTKQLKKSAVTTAKIKNGAVTAKKVKRGSLTGAQINASTLGTVPTAEKANTLAPPENWHEVGSPGEPPFENGWKNEPPSKFNAETVGFYKDQLGVVHLKGVAVPGASGLPAFQLPAGYRPGNSTVLSFAAPCSCSGGVGPVAVWGLTPSAPSLDGAITGPGGATFIGLDGITFRAES
jgi:hypothetical protein